MSSFEELARELLGKENSLDGLYEALANAATSETARKLAGQVGQYQRFQKMSLDLLTGPLPARFLGFGQITHGDVNLRQGPGGRHPLVATLEKGDRLIIQGYEGLWVQVQVPKGPDGWVFKDYVRTDSLEG